MTDPFAKHGLRHLSASSLNLYSAEPALWVLRYLHGFRDDVGPKAWRGQAVEAGLDWWLYKQDRDGALDAAKVAYVERETEFAGNNDGVVPDDADTVGEGIEPMLDQAIEATKDFGLPLARQFKIEHWLDGIEVPVIGYIDYDFEDFLFDLKTTERLPSEPRPEHCRQVALYAAAQKKKAKLVYVTPKKYAVYEVEDADQHLRRLSRMAHSVRALLAMSDSVTMAAQVFAPNYESFYWNDQAIEASKSLWA